MRIIAATHRDLPARVREGGFREDLFYRLERGADRAPAAARAAGRMWRCWPCIFCARSAAALAADAAGRLAAYAWPGNVRELRNALHRAAVLASGETLGAADFAFLDERAAPGHDGGAAE